MEDPLRKEGSRPQPCPHSELPTSYQSPGNSTAYHRSWVFFSASFSQSKAAHGKCHDMRAHKNREIWEAFAFLGFTMTFTKSLLTNSCSASLVPCSLSWQRDGELPLPGPARGVDCFSPSRPRSSYSSWYTGRNAKKCNTLILQRGGLKSALGQTGIDVGSVRIQTIKSVQVNHLLLLHTSSPGLLPAS